MFHISGFPIACRMGAQNGTSKCDNLSYQMPISTWVISMNLWLNSLIIYTKTDLLFFFNPFSCLSESFAETFKLSPTDVCAK